MKISIYNLHNMCENNTFFLSKAWKYFQINGHTVTDTMQEAELIFVGGCAVTDMMRSRCEESILKRMKQLKQAQFVIFGCLAAFPERFQSINGQETYRLHIIPYKRSNELDELIQAKIPFDRVSISRLKGHIPYQPQIGPSDSYVLIAQGCVNDCSYCNIKKVKGKVRSRPEDVIEDEVLKLSRIGIRTVTLLADDCGSYGLDQDSDLTKLLMRLSHVAPDMRYKLYTVFPSLFLKNVTRLEPLFAKHRLPYVCIPIQSASQRVLDLMNRNYDPDEILEAITRIRAMDPEVFIYSHFIFNFPTETWEEFEQSIAFARHFNHSVFIGYGENNSTRAADIIPKCDTLSLQAKAQHLENLVKRGELKAFVVSSP